MKFRPVAVIGVGLSGLCCARHLLKNNIEVLVLEAQDDVGGRVRVLLCFWRARCAHHFRQRGASHGSAAGGWLRVVIGLLR